MPHRTCCQRPALTATTAATTAAQRGPSTPQCRGLRPHQASDRSSAAVAGPGGSAAADASAARLGPSC